MFRKLALTALVLAGCSISPTTEGENQAAIVGGTTDTTDTSVVLVYAQTSSTEASLCSGEVISPHVVLTAAHCVDPAVLGTTSAQFLIYLGDSLDNDMEVGNPQNVLSVLSTTFDQTFDVNNLQNGHDVGIVVTNDAIPRTPIAVNQTTLSSSVVGETVKLVGFGITSSSDTTGTTAGIRRTVSTKVTGLTSLFLEFGSSTVNTCEGDSGGPALQTINGVETIMAITSFGGQNCSTQSSDTLVNDYWTSFISPQMTAGEAAAAAQDMTQATTVTDMAVSISTPTLGDASAGGGGGGSSAVDLAQSTGSTGSTGTAVGGACTTSSQCASGICTLGSANYCTQACNLDDTTTCPSSMKCEEVGSSPYCVFPAKSSGCDAAPGENPARAVGGMLLLFAIALAMRLVDRSSGPRKP